MLSRMSRHLRRLTAASITLLGTAGLLVATTGLSLGTNAACGCGVGEENALLTPVAWSGGGTCPLKEGKVHFTIVTQWCEYELKNNNTSDEIKIKSSELDLKSAECETKRCVVFITGVEAGQKECSNGLKLKAGEKCRQRVEYETKPAKQTELGYDVGLESEPHGGKFFVEKLQIVE